jgi:triacylglycerol lipase
MRAIKRISNALVLLIISNSYLLISVISCAVIWKVLACLVLPALFIRFNIRAAINDCPNKRIRSMSGGTELLALFIFTTLINTVCSVLLYIVAVPGRLSLFDFIMNCVIIIVIESIVFWNGIIRVYCTSVQLGIKTRVIGILLGWIPIANIAALIKIYKTTTRECAFETEKIKINEARRESELCKTRYPLLFVHGVFFRDVRYLNYWGRIPKELEANGASVFYGEQQSASSVESSAEELLNRINDIIQKTGCEKVNVIAHSKGGLDARYAISCLGADKYVASLTTINTPHRGCIFAEYLLGKAPEKLKISLADKYDRTLRKLGEKSPDFISAVNDLTCSRCSEINAVAENKEGVFYQSVGSKSNSAGSGKFPLNVSYPLVRHFDGENDGLVSVESARWGEKFTLISVKGKRGVTHADVIDLNRENIEGFDVRELYVQLVGDLKKLGL